MKAKKFKLTEAELQNHCNSLSSQELKEFQLEDKMDDIKNAQNTLKFFLINVAFCACSLFFAWEKKEIVILIAASVILILSILFSFGFAKRIKQEKLMLKMLELFFHENQI